MCGKTTSSAKVTAWEPVQRIIEGARDVFRLRRQGILDLVARSDLRFQPFNDPLRLNLKRHRWLRGLREENYSDWLHWIIYQMPRPELVLRLFGIADEESLLACQGIKPDVKREEDISKRRLDVTIRCGENLLVVVEVKTTPVGDEVRDQLRDQSDWLDRQKATIRRAVLLAPEPLPEPAERFTVLSWNDLCLALRKMVGELKNTIPLAALGLILGFVGSVEQNVLDYPGCDAIPSNVGIGNWPELAVHIAKTLDLEESNGTAGKH
jgi:hypothetical protein